MSGMITHLASGERVFVECNGMGTVVEDEGIERRGKKVWDFGVIVRMDEDGVEVSAGHAQIIRNPSPEQIAFRP
jgi:hypothetical protein